MWINFKITCFIFFLNNSFVFISTPLLSFPFLILCFLASPQLEKGDKEAGPGWMWLRGTDRGHGVRLLRKTRSSRQTKQAESQALHRSLCPSGGQDWRWSQETRGQAPDRRKFPRPHLRKSQLCALIALGRWLVSAHWHQIKGLVQPNQSPQIKRSENQT